MAIALIATSGVEFDNVSGPLNLSVPTGTADDDIIIFMSSCDGASGLALPSGFTAIQAGQSGGTSFARAGYKIASSEPSTYAISTVSGSERAVGIFATYRGVDTSSPIDSSNINQSGSASHPLLFTALTPTADDCAVICFVATEEGEASSPKFESWPSTTTERYDNVDGPPGSGSASSAAGFADVIQTTATEVSGSVSVSVGADATHYTAIIIALAPEASSENVLTADDLEVDSTLSKPSVGQKQALLADDLEVDSTLSKPSATDSSPLPPAPAIPTRGYGATRTIAEVVTRGYSTGNAHALLADDLESDTNVSSPSVGQAQALLAEDLESDTNVSSPVVRQEHTLIADNLESDTTLSQPSLVAVDGEHVLLADDLESGINVSSPSVGQEQVLFADDLESSTELTSPTLVQVVLLLGDDLESDTNVSSPSVGQEQVLLADDLESDVNVSSPAITQLNILLADDLESAVNISSPSLGQSSVLSADDLESVSEVTSPTLAVISVLLADDLESDTNVSSPSAGQVHILLADDLESSTNISTPVISVVHILTAVDLESGVNVSSPSLGQAEILLSVSLSSDVNVSSPILIHITDDTPLGDPSLLSSDVFGSIRTGHTQINSNGYISWTLHAVGTFGGATLRVEVSMDNINWSDTSINLTGSSIVSFNVGAPYVRVRLARTGPVSAINLNTFLIGHKK